MVPRRNPRPVEYPDGTVRQPQTTRQGAVPSAWSVSLGRAMISTTAVDYVWSSLWKLTAVHTGMDLPSNCLIFSRPIPAQTDRRKVPANLCSFVGMRRGLRG